MIILLILPLLALIFLKPPLTPNPKVDYGACTGSLAANKSFRFSFDSNSQSSGIYSPNGIDISATKTQTALSYGIIQFDNTPEGIKLLGTTDPSTFKCGNNSCRFINLDPGGPNNDTPYQQINNNVFRLFKENNLVPKAEFPWHLGWVGQISLPDEPSKKRNVWMVLSDCHGNGPRNVTGSLCALGKDGSGNIQPDTNYNPNKLPSAVGWSEPTTPANATQPAFFLLYVQKDTPTTYGDNFLNFDLYYKVGANGELDLTKDLPKFIQNFCKNSEPITPLSIVQIGPNSYDPPKEFNLSDPIQGIYSSYNSTTLECPNLTQKYKLMLYTKFGGTTTGLQGLSNNVSNPQKSFCGQYILNNSASQNSPDNSKYYVGLVSAAKFITLTDSKLTYTYYYLPDNSTPTAPNPSASPILNHNLQLTTFNLDQVLPWGWWVPECKPAIYLYPTTTQQVSVKVTPKGYLTYTDPPYPIPDGWRVTAHPDGKIISNSKTYPYLYYESKIHDQWIDKPLTGFVTSKQDLTSTLSRILPQLGLNQRETQDFINYWIKSLPNSPYYYLRVLTNAAINKIEPLQVVPTPDTNIRVRIYFQALDKPIEIAEPQLELPPTRQGFSLVEWGGLVKNDPNHPFTCSQ